MDATSVNRAAQVLPGLPEAASPNWLAENRELIRTVKRIDAARLFGDGSELTFAMDHKTRRPEVRVIDRQTREVLWQAPPEYVLRMAEVMGPASGLHG